MTEFAKMGACCLLALYLAGCASYIMPITYQPTVTPQIVETGTRVGAVNVRDIRGTAPNWLGAIRGGYGNPLKKIYSEENASVVVQKAFSQALKFRGLYVGQPPGHYRIDVELEKFDTSYFYNKEAHAHFTITLTDQTSGRPVFSRSYQTDNERKGSGAGIFGNVEELALFANETLNQNIDKVLTDPDFIGVFGPPDPSDHSSESGDERIKELDDLLEKGLITEDEYQAMRARILSG